MNALTATAETCEILVDLALSIDAQSVVETGTGDSQGSTLYLWRALGPGKITTVDINPVPEENKLDGVEYVCGSSHEFAETVEHADLSFVDCAIDKKWRASIVNILLPVSQIVVCDDTGLLDIDSYVSRAPDKKLLNCDTGLSIWYRSTDYH